jgi:hypothetical protein
LQIAERSKTILNGKASPTKAGVKHVDAKDDFAACASARDGAESMYNP